MSCQLSIELDCNTKLIQPVTIFTTCNRLEQLSVITNCKLPVISYAFAIYQKIYEIYLKYSVDKILSFKMINDFQKSQSKIVVNRHDENCTEFHTKTMTSLIFKCVSSIISRHCNVAVLATDDVDNVTCQ